MLPHIIKIIVFSGILLSVIGCSTDEGIRMRYEAEKEFFEAERFRERSGLTLENPDIRTLQQVKSKYNSLVNFSYTSLKQLDSTQYPVEFREISDITYKAVTRLSELLFSEKKYDSCLARLTQALSDLDLNVFEQISLNVSLGQTLQASGRWDSAVAVYNRAIENFYPPVDFNGDVIYNLFNLPSHIYLIYKQIGDSTLARQYFPKAEQYYQKIIKDYPETNLSVSAHANLARLYNETANWTRTIENLRALTDTTGKIDISAHLRIGDIYAAHLKKPRTALAIYDSVFNDLAVDDSILKPVIIYKKSLVYLEMKNFNETRRLLSELENLYPQYYRFNPTAQYVKARSFELQGNWDRAVTEYKYLINSYPNSEEAMSVHLYLARKMEELGRKSEAEYWLKAADEFYRNLADQYRGDRREALAMSYLAELEKRRQNWSASADILTDIYDKFPDSDIGYRSLLTAAGIYRDRLHEPAKADSLVEVLKQALTRVEVQLQNQDLLN